MISKSIFQYIVLFSFIVIMLNGLLFADLSVDFIFLLGNFVVVILSVFLISYCQKNYMELNEKKFLKKIFKFSLGFRIFSVLFYYALFYFITGTEFDVEAIDALWYDEGAQQISVSFWNGTLSVEQFFIYVRGSFDDSGYVVFLSLIYSVFGNNVIIARLIQAIISALTVVLIYKIGKQLFDEKTGKLSAILLGTFQPLALYASLHLKETLMVYFLVLFIYLCIKLLTTQITPLSVVVLFFSLLALFSFRTVLGLTALISLIGSLIIEKKYSVKKKIVILGVFGVIVYGLAANLSVLNDAIDKSKKYIGIETDSKGSIGGRTMDGQGFAKYAGGGVFLLQSIVMPYPSMVKTNIVYYNQTLQWYFAGGLLIWAFLSYYAYIGIYYSIKSRFRQRSILIFNTAIYTLALISSFYITSIRFNIIKLVLLIPFVAYGVILSDKRKESSFIKYAIVISLVVLLWNYIKIAGRGLV